MKKSILLALLVMVWLAVPVRAVEPGTAAVRAKASPRPALNEVNRELQGIRQNLSENRCQLAESKINFRLNMYQQNRDKHYKVYQGIKNSINTFVAKYENRGCDIAGIKADVVKLETLIQEFSAAHRDLVSSLQAIRTYRCGESEGQFAASVREGREKLLVVQQKSTAVRTFIQSTLKPELTQTAKTCRPTPKPSTRPSADAVSEGKEGGN